LIEHIVALSQLAIDVPEVAEVEINPVSVSAQGATFLHARVRLGRNALQRAGVPRQLSVQSAQAERTFDSVIQLGSE
jgi:succinyl-CoA synthetase beta subunit